jgi:hypothetical protein
MTLHRQAGFPTNWPVRYSAQPISSRSSDDFAIAKKVTLQEIQDARYKLQNQNKPMCRPVENNEKDLTIATHINFKRKGWAWKRDIPINLAETCHTQALIRWAATQQFWHRFAVGQYTKGLENARWQDVYTDMCIEMSEGRLTSAEFGVIVRDMLATAIADFLQGNTHGH